MSEELKEINRSLSEIKQFLSAQLQLQKSILNQLEKLNLREEKNGNIGRN